ncbi:CU044_2847 family protein [Streptomyces venezuelae]|uniref:CU044_2847 family protein n=1 Tax=Streptomyces venezuelae TaxID=54571 RepID=UPI0037D934B5
MGDVRLTFDDGSVVRLHLVPEDGRTAGPAGAEAGPDDDLDLPAGFGSARPVSADGRAAQALTRGGEALTQALRPLGGVLGGIHRSFSQFAERPDEVTVEFGVTLGSDLSLGVFSGSGEASFTVSATWNLADRADGGAGTDPADGTGAPVATPADGTAPVATPADGARSADAVGTGSPVDAAVAAPAASLPVPGPVNGS